MAKKDPTLQNLTKSFIKTDNSKIANIVDFIDNPHWGLGIEVPIGEDGEMSKFRLSPVQNVMIKAYYGIPLDKVNKCVPVWNLSKTKLLFEGLTEWEFQEWLYSEGRTNLRPEELKIGRNYKNLVLVLGRRSGKCRYEGDLINTTIGSITFKELLERKDNGENIGIFTYDDKTLKQQITYDFKIWSNGIKECYELKTRKGTIETSSGNHPYLVWRDDFEEPKFVNLLDLKKGDRIAIANQNNMFGEGGIGLNKAKILGYLIGNGNEKYIPDCILKGNREEVASFLSRLFACDNCVYELRDEKNTSRIEINYSSLSRRLVLEIKHLLLKFGIHCQIEKRSKYENDLFVYYLTINTKKDYFLFVENIGILGKEKVNTHYEKEESTSDVIWDEVDSITNVGQLNTVDLEVANTHIIGGDIISHNSLLTSCISCYELYKLVKRSDPASYYGFPKGQEIRITSVAPTDTQAGIVYNMLLSFVTNCPYLKNRVLNQTQGYFNLQTDVDLETSTASKKRATLTALTGGCSSNSLRGGNSLVVILDEMAFFLSGDSSRFADGEVYKALTPSTASFSVKKEGEEIADGKIICISSPRAKYGKFYEEYNNSFELKESYLMYKMYSALVNPERLTKEYLEEERKKDKRSFMCEFGAEFSDKITAWIEEEEDFRKCIVNNPKYIQELEPTDVVLDERFQKTEDENGEIVEKKIVKIEDGDFWFKNSNRTKYIRKGGLWLPFVEKLRERGEVGIQYYYGLDLGLKDDGTAIGICHKRPDGKIEIDYVNAWYSGSSVIWDFKDSNIYSIYNKYKDKETLSMIDIANEIKEIKKWFPIVKGTFDQHNGMVFKQYLDSLGITQFEMVYSNEQIKHDMFQTFKTLYMEERLVIPDHFVLVQEMLGLEAEMKSKGRIEVKKAKEKKNSKDDISDAIVRAVYLCYNETIGDKVINEEVNCNRMILHNGVQLNRSMMQKIQEIKAKKELNRIKMRIGHYG